MRTLAVVAVLVLMWTVGLMAFADRARRSTPPPEPAAAEGIVVLTGASDARIVAGFELLKAGKGRRLLVSGVHKDVRRQELRALAAAPPRLFDCCVDLGFEAADTIGNAQEIAAWARAKRFERLIVVTSDYHMPRSILEIRGAMPEATLTPYPVRSPTLDADRWWHSGRAFQRMALEYCKYLAVLVRETVLGATAERRAAAAGAETEPQPEAGA